MKKLLLLTLLCSAPLAAMDFVSDISGVYSGDLKESLKSETLKVSQEEQEQLNKRLLKASRNGDIEKVRQALASGANIEAQNQDKWTPLHYAAGYGLKDVVALLIEKGARMEAQDQWKSTPLHYAAGYGLKDVVALLIEKGARMEAQNHSQKTPLHCAAYQGKTDVVALLLEKGANIEAQDQDKWTPLHWASYKGKTDVVELLIEKGAKLEAQDQWEMTPLHYAAGYGLKDVVALLIEKGAKLEAQDAEEKTPLHYAAMDGKTDVVALLIEKGADIEVQDQGQHTPLHWAASNGKTDVVALLKAAESLQRGGIKLAFNLINQDWSNLQMFLGSITAHILRQNSVKQYYTQMIKNKNKSDNLKKLFDLTDYKPDFSSYKNFVGTLKLVTPKFIMNKHRKKLEQENMLYVKSKNSFDCNIKL